MLSLLIVLLAGMSCLVRAADPLSDAALVAAQRDAEEKYRRLAADVQNLLETQEALLKRQDELRQRVDKLSDEIRAFKDEHSRSSGNSVSREEFRKYAEKLKEIDDKREADKKLILENIKDLAKLPVAVPPPEKPSNRRNVDTAPEEQPFVYTVKKNDRLLDIVAEYNNEYFQKRGLKLTVDHVLKANPGLKADHLVAGRRIRIPVPAKDAK
jgi:seryl-tRNA synthetase